MRYCRSAVLVIVLLACLSATRGPVATAAARHHFYVGTITALAGGSLAIHSKTHNATYRFVFDKQTDQIHASGPGGSAIVVQARLLRHGQLQFGSA